MRLHFKSDAGRIMNISTAPENWNDDATEYETIAISEKDYDKLLRIMDFDMIPYSHDLEKTAAQHERDAQRVINLEKICDKISAGEFLQAPRCIDKNGHSHPRSKQLQRDIISITMLIHPDMSISEIATTTGASRNTVRRCRDGIGEYEKIISWYISMYAQEGGEPWQ